MAIAAYLPSYIAEWIFLLKRIFLHIRRIHRLMKQIFLFDFH